MGHLKEFSLPVRLFLETYRWRRIDPVPWAPLPKPMDQCRLAIISTAGFVAEGQIPFDHSRRGGDCSYREISSDTKAKELKEFHRSKSFDHSGIQEDPNLAIPLDRMHELAEAGLIGQVNRRHFSFMGSITAPGRLMRDSAPQAARSLKEDAVDVALLVPV